MNASGNDVTAAVNRFGLGAKPGELASVRDPRGWLNAQLARGVDAGNAFAGLPGSLDYLREEAQLQMARREFRRGGRGRRAFLKGDMQGASKDGQANAAALKAYYERLRTRPSVAKAVAEEFELYKAEIARHKAAA